MDKERAGEAMEALQKAVDLWSGGREGSNQEMVCFILQTLYLSILDGSEENNRKFNLLLAAAYAAAEDVG